MSSDKDMGTMARPQRRLLPPGPLVTSVTIAGALGLSVPSAWLQAQAADTGRSFVAQSSTAATVPWSLIQPKFQQEDAQTPGGFFALTDTPKPGSVRLALPLRLTHAVKGFSRDGVGQSFGLEGESSALDVSLAMGIAHRLAFVAVVPFGLSSQRSLIGSRYRKTEPYSLALNELRGRVAAQLQTDGVCFSKPACVALIAAGYAPQAGFSLDLGSEEAVMLQPGVPIDRVLDAVAVGEMLPASGWSGLGDVRLGFKYEWVKFFPQRARDLDPQSVEPLSPWGFAVEVLGVMPTAQARPWSRIEDSPGAGTTDLVAAVATDLELERNTTLAARYSATVEVAKGRRAQPSRLDGRMTLGGRAPTFKRMGLGQSAFVGLNYAMEGLLPQLRPLAVQLGYAVDVRRAERLGEQQVRSENALQTVSGEVRFFSVAGGWPVSLIGSFGTPIFGSGDFIFLAPWVLGVTAELLMPSFL